MTPNLFNYMSDMHTFLEKKEKKKEEPAPKVPDHDFYLLKEDWKRVVAYRDRMAVKQSHLPVSRRKLESEALANTLTYMLSKFKIREVPK